MENKIRVGSAVVLENDKGEVLLVKRKYEPAKGYWVLPGGRIEYGESFTATPVRELKEETGLNISVGDQIGAFEIISPEENVHRVIVFHKANLLGGTLKLADDAEDAIWIRPEKIRSTKNLSDLAPKVLERAGYL
jgi:ADP-ribose pyrophosphatase YjhB (NUDIX family)